MNTFKWIMLFIAWGTVAVAIISIVAFGTKNDYINKLKD